MAAFAGSGLNSSGIRAAAPRKPDAPEIPANRGNASALRSAKRVGVLMSRPIRTGNAGVGEAMDRTGANLLFRYRVPTGFSLDHDAAELPEIAIARAGGSN